jgi:hypothetical protein
LELRITTVARRDGALARRKGAVRDKEIPVETFDALLRDLVTWGLVVPADDDDGRGWLLVPRAQERLAQLTRARGPWPEELTAYLGRRCGDCKSREVTWLRHGAYVCDRCWQRRLARSDDSESDVVPADSSRSRWGRRRRAGIA